STTATVRLEMVGGGPKITAIDLRTEAEVPGIDEAKFKEQAELTKKTCPVSVALAGTQINLEAKLLWRREPALRRFDHCGAGKSELVRPRNTRNAKIQAHQLF